MSKEIEAKHACLAELNKSKVKADANEAQALISLKMFCTAQYAIVLDMTNK